MGAVQQDLNIRQGKTFSAVFGWAEGRFVWGEITGVANSAPVALTVVGHGLLDGWPYWISDLKKPVCLNNVTNGCSGEDDTLGDPYLAEVVDADTLSINHINGMRLDVYQGGGAIRYYARADITGYEALMQVRRAPGDQTVLFEASSSGTDPMITVDPATATFSLNIPAAAFATATWREAYYEIEITSPDGDVYQLARGSIFLEPEVVQ